VSRNSDGKLNLLRHTVATLAYRGEKTLRGVPDDFSPMRLGDKTRTPTEILAHMGDLLDWALSLAQGKERWQDSSPRSWGAEVSRFFVALKELDEHLGSGAPLQCPAEKLFQGPIADAFTHVGQIALLRRLAGSPVRGENYFKADIVSGRVGVEQSDRRKEFE
jgi:hypothetical protein